MPKAATKTINISLAKDNMVGVDISAYQNYKSATVSVKISDKEYMRVTYEWGTDNLPEFVVDLMGFMQANKEDIEVAKEKLIAEYSSFIGSK